MKTLILFAALIFGSFAEANYASIDYSIQLTPRYGHGNLMSTSYSFRYLTRDNAALTDNYWDIFLIAQANTEDYFTVDTIIDSYSFIFDLGEMSCKNIFAFEPDLRTTKPLTWLALSAANPKEFAPSSQAKVLQGHCYLVYGNDSFGRYVALFRVKEHIPSYKVIIDEIEVLEGALVKSEDAPFEESLAPYKKK